MSVDEAVAAAEQAARAALRREGADPRRRPRQGQVQGTGRPTPRAACASPRSLDEVRAAATDMLGNTLVTIQTGEHGKQVNRLYVTDGADIAKEYLSLDAGRSRDRPHRHGRLDRGRHGHRDRRARHAREDPDDRHRSGRPASCRITAAPSPFALEADRRSRQAGAEARRASSTTRSSPPTWRCSRSTRWSRPTTASCWCSTPRSRSIRTRCSATRTSLELRDETEEDPAEVEASQVRPRLHQARRRHRLHGQRRRPRHGDDGHHQAERHVPGQLPRRRRRRHRRRR